jgi:hypothetical protein
VGCGLAPPRAEGSGWSRLPLPAPNPPPPMPDLRGDDPIHGKEDRICHLHTRKTVGQCRLLHHCWYRRGERERENCAEEVELLTTAVHVAAGHTAAHSGSGEAGMGLGRCWWWRGDGAGTLLVVAWSEAARVTCLGATRGLSCLGDCA